MDVPVIKEHNIERLSRSVMREKLARTLFGTPDKTASDYCVHYMERTPFVLTTHNQFAIDPSWNRIPYSNPNRWIKSYDNLNGSSAIAVDSDGRVAIGGTGNKRVIVCHLAGEGPDATIEPLFFINDIHSPTDIAHSDNGIPLNTSDDILYVADASQNRTLKYALAGTGATLTSTSQGFDSPTSIVVDKWHGSNNGLLDVVDQIGKRLRVSDDLGSQLSIVKEVRGNYYQYYKSLKADHFENIHVIDNVNSQILKFISSLELPDTQGGDGSFATMGNIDVPFGKIVVDGQGAHWSGGPITVARNLVCLG